MIKTILYLIYYILTFAFGHIAGKYLVLPWNIKRHMHEKLFCNECEAAFVSTTYELDYKYCPYCGNNLDFHKEDERSRYYEGE